MCCFALNIGDAVLGRLFFSSRSITHNIHLPQLFCLPSVNVTATLNRSVGTVSPVRCQCATRSEWSCGGERARFFPISHQCIDARSRRFSVHIVKARYPLSLSNMVYITPFLCFDSVRPDPSDLFHHFDSQCLPPLSSLPPTHPVSKFYAPLLPPPFLSPRGPFVVVEFWCRVFFGLLSSCRKCVSRVFHLLVHVHIQHRQLAVRVNAVSAAAKHGCEEKWSPRSVSRQVQAKRSLLSYTTCPCHIVYMVSVQCWCFLFSTE